MSVINFDLVLDDEHTFTRDEITLARDNDNGKICVRNHYNRNLDALIQLDYEGE